jgi:hypothetical protein
LFKIKLVTGESQFLESGYFQVVDDIFTFYDFDDDGDQYNEMYIPFHQILWIKELHFEHGPNCDCGRVEPDSEEVPA